MLLPDIAIRAAARGSADRIQCGRRNPPACTGQAHARILRALISCEDSPRIPGHELGLRRRPVLGSRSYPIAIVSSSRSSRIASFSSKGKAADSARVCRLCLRQAACSSVGNEFKERYLFTATLITLHLKNVAQQRRIGNVLRPASRLFHGN